MLNYQRVPKSDLRKLQKDLHGSDGSWRFLLQIMEKSSFRRRRRARHGIIAAGPSVQGTDSFVGTTMVSLQDVSIAMLPSSD